MSFFPPLSSAETRSAAPIFLDADASKSRPRSILVHGPYHTSAPIHLCLSFLAEQDEEKALDESSITSRRTAVFLTPSREKFLRALKEYDDDYLYTRSGTGRISEVSSRVKLFYAPTLEHLHFLLSVLRVSRIDDMEVYPEFNEKTTLTEMPELVVLHEPSAYLCGDDGAVRNQEYTVSTYLNLIAHTFSCISSLCSGPVDPGIQTQAPHRCTLALFDTQLSSLKLPIIKSLYRDIEPNPFLVHPENVEHDPTEEEERHVSVRLHSVLGLAEKYFEYRADFEQSQVDGNNLTRLRRLHRNGPAREDVCVSWCEVAGSLRSFDDPQGSKGRIPMPSF